MGPTQCFNKICTARPPVGPLGPHKPRLAALAPLLPLLGLLLALVALEAVVAQSEAQGSPVGGVGALQCTAQRMGHLAVRLTVHAVLH